jgi:hypothetical protein
MDPNPVNLRRQRIQRERHCGADHRPRHSVPCARSTQSRTSLRNRLLPTRRRRHGLCRGRLPAGQPRSRPARFSGRVARRGVLDHRHDTARGIPRSCLLTAIGAHGATERHFLLVHRFDICGGQRRLAHLLDRRNGDCATQRWVRGADCADLRCLCQLLKQEWDHRAAQARATTSGLTQVSPLFFDALMS